MKVVTQMPLGVVGMLKSLQRITFTQPVRVPPLVVVPLQEVQGCGIRQLGITQYLEIEI